MVSEVGEQGRYIDIHNEKTTQIFTGPERLTGERCSGLFLEGSIRKWLITDNSFCGLVIEALQKVIALVAS